MMITTLMMMIKRNLPSNFFIGPTWHAPLSQFQVIMMMMVMIALMMMAHLPFTTPGDDSDGNDHYYDNEQNNNAELFLFSDSSVKMSCA